MDDNIFSVTFKSDFLHVKSIVSDSLTFILNAFPDISDETVFEIKLVLSEALLNAVTHGNNNDTEKNVWLKIEKRDSASVVITVADEGEGCDYEALLNARIGEERLYSECGRGVLLMDSLSEELCYNDSGNIVEIYKKVVSNG